MIDLDLMKYKKSLKLKTEDEKRYIFDPIRKKWLVLQPEELVRQLMILYLLEEKKYNKNRINVEKEIVVNRLQKRCDILVFDKDMENFLLVECKAPHVPIHHEVFKQIAWYNMALKVKYLVVTNGQETFCSIMNYEEESFEFLSRIPDYPDFIG